MSAPALPLRAHMQRALRGLYHGAQIGNGRHVTYADNRTKRKFMPNIVTKTFSSQILDKSFQFRVSTRALRTIERVGGLDNYLKKYSHKTIDSNVGSELKDKIDRKLFLERSAVEYQQRVRVAAQQEIARMQNKSAAPATTAAAEKSDAEKSGKVAGSPSTAALHSFVNHRKVTVKAL